MKEEITLNTNELSEEEKKVLESTFAFECCTGYNVIGAKQYRFSKEQLVSDLTNSLTRLDQQDFEIDKINMLRQTIPAILIVLVAGIISTMISQPWLVILPAAILYTTDLLINKKLTAKNKKKLNAEKEIRKTLISKVEEEYKKQALREKINTNEKLKETIKNDITTRYLVSTVLKDYQGNTNEEDRNISNAAIGAKTEEKTQESPKQMIKGKNN